MRFSVLLLLSEVHVDQANAKPLGLAEKRGYLPVPNRHIRRRRTIGRWAGGTPSSRAGRALECAIHASNWST